MALDNQFALDATAEPLTVQAYKDMGMSITYFSKKATGKPYDLVKMEEGGKMFLATESIKSTRAITLESYVIPGRNKDKEPRLYLTNNKGLVGGEDW